MASLGWYWGQFVSDETMGMSREEFDMGSMIENSETPKEELDATWARLAGEGDYISADSFFDMSNWMEGRRRLSDFLI